MAACVSSQRNPIATNMGLPTLNHMLAQFSRTWHNRRRKTLGGKFYFPARATINFSPSSPLLGSVTCLDPQGEYVLTGTQAGRLLAYLGVAGPSRVPRETVAEALWPEAPPGIGLRRLADLLYRLRARLADGWFDTQPKYIGLAEATVEVDLWTFQALVESGSPEAESQALELYRGPLAPQVDDEWILAARVAVEEQYFDLLLKAAIRADRVGDPATAVTHYRRLALADPLREEAVRGWMRALARLGRHAEALEVYHQLETTLARELAIAPSLETLKLAQAIRRERGPEGNRPVRREVEAVPFVGRQEEREKAVLVLEQALRGRGALVAVEGPAGIGKTRFLDEVMASARWRGLSVGYGKTKGPPSDSPYSPLEEALRQTLQRVPYAVLARQAPRWSLEAIAPLSLGLPGQRASPPADPMEIADERLWQGLQEFVRALNQISPCLLVLDDLHLAQPDLWKALFALFPLLQETSLTIFIAYRRPEIDKTSGWSVLQSIERARGMTLLRLGPLTRQELAVCLEAGELAALGRLHALSGGIPLYFEQALLSLRQQGSLEQWDAASRLDRLSPRARNLLHAAAVLGEKGSLEVLLAVVGKPSVEALAGLTELTDAGLIGWDDTTYTFVHEVVWQQAYAGVPLKERRALHGRAAKVLAELQPHPTRALAYHFEQAGQRAKAARLYRQVGEESLSRFAFQDAQSAIQRALTLSPSEPSASRVRTLLTLAKAAELAGDVAAEASAVQEALSLVEHLQAPDLQAAVLAHRGQMLTRAGDYEAARRDLERALHLIEAQEDASMLIEVLMRLGDLALMDSPPAEACHWFERACQLARSNGTARQLALALDGLAFALANSGGARETVVAIMEEGLDVARRAGDRFALGKLETNLLSILQASGSWDLVIRRAPSVIADLQNIGYPRTLCAARQAYGLSLMALGDFEQAASQVSKARADMEALGERFGVAIATDTLGLIAWRKGDLPQALSYFQEALEQARSLGAKRLLAFVQMDLGAFYQGAGEPALAVPLLERAHGFWRQAGDVYNAAKSMIHLGLALVALGRQQEAARAATEAWAALGEASGIEGEDPAVVLWHLYLLFDALGLKDQAHSALVRSYQELQRQARRITDMEARSAFFHRVPLHRSLVQAYDHALGVERQQRVWLVREDKPLGQALREGDRVLVQWTVHAPEDETIEDKVARRRYVIRRLVAESRDQGALPTDEELARALQVSRRTVLRDIQALQRLGQHIPTRRRVRR